MTIHRTLDGDWAECTNPNCNLKFHFSDLTVAEAETIPLLILLPLLKIMDPPTRSYARGTKIWRDEHGRLHRDYDLPAGISSEGSLWWHQHGKEHRTRGPAMVPVEGPNRYMLHGKTYTYEQWRQMLDA